MYNVTDNDMTIDMVMKEKTYNTKEIAEHLGIADSTLRKYCLLLEEHGYNFRRNEFQKREYSEHDVIALRKFKDLTKDGAMSLEDAAIAVKTGYNRVPNNAITGAVTTKNDRYDESYAEVEARIAELTDLMSRQMQFNEALLSRLDAQQKFLEERLEISDHRILEAVKMITNTQKELAESTANRNAAAPEPRKSFFQRLFGK